MLPSSLPAWEGWIEIEMGRDHIRLCMSLPAWEGWIEIVQKVIESLTAAVPSRMGRVD